jgi:hypothetical protein
MPTPWVRWPRRRNRRRGHGAARLRAAAAARDRRAARPGPGHAHRRAAAAGRALQPAGGSRRGARSPRGCRVRPGWRGKPRWRTAARRHCARRCAPHAAAAACAFAGPASLSSGPRPLCAHVRSGRACSAWPRMHPDEPLVSPRTPGTAAPAVGQRQQGGAVAQHAPPRHSERRARAATLCLQAGADGITVHPRPDERHIRPTTCTISPRC